MVKLSRAEQARFFEAEPEVFFLTKGAPGGAAAPPTYSSEAQKARRASSINSDRAQHRTQNLMRNFDADR
jgi:hypothetical protein